MPNVHPMLGIFIKLTALIAIGIVGFVLLLVLFKIIVVAAVIAALVVGGFFVYQFFRRRSQLPVIR